MWKRVSARSRLPVIGGLALMLGACGTSLPQDVPGLRAVIGSSVPGAQGLTVRDQDRIDEHVARGCRAGLYTADECARHTPAAAERRAALSAQQ